MMELTSQQRLLLAPPWLALLLGAGWVIGRAEKGHACGTSTRRRRGLDPTLAGCPT